MKSKYVGPLYGFALRLSSKSRRFYASQVQLAGYFGCSRRTIGIAFRELEVAGFFFRLSRYRFCTNVYTVLDHPTWAKYNPGKCPTKIEMPWSAESSKLGRELHAICGGLVKFRPQQIRFLQFNYSEEEIKQVFRNLVSRSVPVDRHGYLDAKNLNWSALFSEDEKD
jgi:hypothetical protein